MSRTVRKRTTQFEHNRSAYPSIADVRADIDDRSGSANAGRSAPRQAPFLAAQQIEPTHERCAGGVGKRNLPPAWALSTGPMNDVAQSSELSRPTAPQAREFPTPVRVRAPGLRGAITSVKEALGFIDRLPAELARLPRWTFARALFVEVERTGKSRDVNAAVRQLRQALSNEKWLDEGEES
jgi:hypothetical protein